MHDMQFINQYKVWKCVNLFLLLVPLRLIWTFQGLKYFWGRCWFLEMHSCLCVFMCYTSSLLFFCVCTLGYLWPFALKGSIKTFSLCPVGSAEIQFSWLRWIDGMLFSAGCPHCKNAVPHFITAAETFKEDRKVRRNLMKKNFPLVSVLVSVLTLLSGAITRHTPSLIDWNLPELLQCLVSYPWASHPHATL